MNQRSKRFSQTNLSYVEEMKSKLQKLDFIRNTTNAMIAQSDFLPKRNTKLKTLNQQKLIYPIARKQTLEPLSRLSIRENLSSDKSILDIKSQDPTVQFHSNNYIPFKSYSQTLNSPANDEQSTLSVPAYPVSPINPSADTEQISNRDKFQHDFQEDSQINEFSYRKYRTTRSITSSSSTSKNSRDEPLLAPDTLIIGKLYILNDLYPSIDHENMNGTPLAFLGAEKFLRTRIDWTKVQYPLSSYHIEIIIDLIIARPSFIREIPKVTQFNLYRPLNKTVSSHLFFDHGENKAGIHQCDRKLINRKFTIQDLASIHRREFHIINHNITHEQRFINLYENLFQIHLYQTKSNHWKKYLIKPKYPVSTSHILSNMSLDNVETHHINTLLTLNRTFSPITSTGKSTQKQNSLIGSQQSSAISSTII